MTYRFLLMFWTASEKDQTGLSFMEGKARKKLPLLQDFELHQKSEKFRNCIIGTDESKMEMPGHHVQQHVWWNPNTPNAFKPSWSMMVQDLMVWVCFAATRPEKWSALCHTWVFLSPSVQQDWNWTETGLKLGHAAGQQSQKQVEEQEGDGMVKSKSRP